MKTSILKLNIKNLNNRIYTEDNIRYLLDDYDSNNPIYITSSSPLTWGYKLEDLVGYVESFEFERDVVYANIYIFPHQKSYEDAILSKGYVLRPSGLGELEGDYVVDYKIVYLNVVSREDDAFKGIL